MTGCENFGNFARQGDYAENQFILVDNGVKSLLVYQRDYLWSANLSKSFAQLIVLIFISFFNIFSLYFAR